LHSVELKGLEPWKSYAYICGSRENGFSEMNAFFVPKFEMNEPNFHVIGALYDN
jgi:hypothetical protein